MGRRVVIRVLRRVAVALVRKVWFGLTMLGYAYTGVSPQPGVDRQAAVEPTHSPADTEHGAASSAPCLPRPPYPEQLLPNVPLSDDEQWLWSQLRL
jgi:hypothetical protein